MGIVYGILPLIVGPTNPNCIKFEKYKYFRKNSILQRFTQIFFYLPSLHSMILFLNYLNDINFLFLNLSLSLLNHVFSFYLSPFNDFASYLP